MKYPLIIIPILFIFSFSCKDDDVIENNDEETIEEMIDEHLIQSYIWERLIDSTSILDRERHFLDFPVLFENLILYGNHERNGFIAFDRANGEEVWNNYGQIDFVFIRDRPIVHEGICYFIDSNKLIGFDARDGSIVHDFLITNDPNETVNEEMAIFENQIYISVIGKIGEINSYSEWLVTSVNDIAPSSFFRFNRNEVYVGGSPLFYKLSNGENIMIYRTTSESKALTSYNLSQQEIEWTFQPDQLKNFNFFILDEEAVYFATGTDLYGIDIATGNRLWSNLDVFYNNIEGGLFLHDNELFTVGSTTIRKIDKNTGAVIWDKVGYELDDGQRTFFTNVNDAALLNGKIYMLLSNSFKHQISINLDDVEVEYFRLARRLEVDGIETTLGPLTFDFSKFAISEDGILYSNDAFRFFAYKVQ